MVKTYSRKQQEPTIIEDVLVRCRLCLTRADCPLAIFPRERDACAVLALRIMFCTGYEVFQDDSLPNIICTDCHTELERYYKFRRKCEDSYRKLKSHIDAIKEKEKILPIEHDTSENNVVIPECERDNMKCLENEKSLENMKCIENEKSLENMKCIENVDIVDPVDEFAQLVIADGSNLEEANDTNDKTDMSMVASVTNVETEEVIEETEIQLIEQNSELNPDISTFLNAILVELGILSKEAGGLRVQDRGVAGFALETGDGDQLVFQLEEEEEEPTVETSLPEEPVDVKAGESTAEPITVSDDSKTDGQKRIRKNNTYGKNGAWCAQCGRSLSSASALRRHAARHAAAAPRPHACPHAGCGRRFTQKAVMKRHSMLHEEHRPFQCGSCPRSFTQRGALAAHAHTHAPTRGLALHACTLCDRVFLYQSGLSRHMVTHTNRTFPCTTCSRPFKDRSSLARHIRTAHRTLANKDAAEPSRDTASSERVA